MKRAHSGSYVSIATMTERARAFIPADLPPNPALDWSQDLRASFDKAILAIGRLDAVPTLLPEAKTLTPLLNRKEALLSSISEETTTSLEDLLAFGADIELSGENKVISEVFRLSELISRIWEGVGQDESDFIGLMLQAHAELFGGEVTQARPGNFRENNNRLSVTQPGNAAFIPPPAEHIRECMDSLQRFLNDRPTTTPFLVKAALAQAQFEMIQPFAVGNSRLARMILTMMMKGNGVMSSPILVTSSYFAKNRREYFAALNNVRANGDWESWLGYFATAVAHSAETSFELIRNLTDRIAKDESTISELGRPAESALQIFRAMISQPIATSNWLVRKTGITPATVNKSLVHLGEIGVINETSSRKRNRVFAYTTYIEILKSDIEDVFV